MIAVLQLLFQVQPWHLVAVGLVGATLCIGLGRTAAPGLIGAMLCAAVALAGIVAMWRANNAPRQLAIVTARTVGAAGGDDGVEWKFEAPYSIFLHSRRPGDLLGIDGIQIFAKNLSARPLRNLTAVVRSFTRGIEMKMNLVLDGRQVDASEAQTVPAKSEFSLLYVIPATVDARASGIPADQLMRDFGDLCFTFKYDTNQMFARLVSAQEIEVQLLRIEREAGNALLTPVIPRLYR